MYLIIVDETGKHRYNATLFCEFGAVHNCIETRWQFGANNELHLYENEITDMGKNQSASNGIN